MKTQSVALAAHRTGGTTTLAYCWRITRKDSTVFRYTSLDQDLTFDGEVYLAADGFRPSELQAMADLSVTNLDVTGLTHMVSVSDEDVANGVWDDAAVRVFEVNYTDLSQGSMELLTGKVGNLTVGSTSFTAEQRGQEQPLQSPFGRIYAPTCDATLGDARCGVDVVALEVAGTVTTGSGRRSFLASGLGQPLDYFSGGLLVWDTGLNAGLGMEVQQHNAGGDFTLALQMPYNTQVGDTFTVQPGCRKRRVEDCIGKFNNAINFRGFDLIPGNNRMVGNAGRP